METIVSDSLNLLTDWRAWVGVILYSLFGMSLGLANYYLGQKGLEAVQSKVPALNPETFDKVESYYSRWGSRAAVLSGVPVVNTVVCLAARIYGTRLMPFLLWSALGLLARNWLLLLVIYVILSGIT